MAGGTGWAQFAQARAVRDWSLIGLARVGREWPLDWQVRNSALEWVMTFPTNGLARMLVTEQTARFEPWSPDVLVSRIEYRLELGDGPGALAAWRRLARLAPRSRIVAKVLASKRRPSPQGLGGNDGKEMK